MFGKSTASKAQESQSGWGNHKLNRYYSALQSLPRINTHQENPRSCRPTSEAARNASP
jgi:hypothetical protein